MSRRWLRLVAVLSLGIYLLANPQVCHALDHWLDHDAHCQEHTDDAPNGESDEPTPCDAPNPGNNHSSPECPCDGGCAICSASKAPCLAPLTLNLHVSLCVATCCDEVSFEYAAPLQRGLIRPPRT